jgi:hypothetical protein
MIDGMHFPMEMHLVHYKQSYGSFDEAVNKADGLVVIGALFSVRIGSITVLINSGIVYMNSGYF